MRSNHARTVVRARLAHALALLLLLVSILPMMGGTAHAAGVNLNDVASLAQVDFPGGPRTELTAGLAVGTQCSQGTPCSVSVGETDLSQFPSAGQLLVGKHELMAYSGITRQFKLPADTGAIKSDVSGDRNADTVPDPAAIRQVVVNITTGLANLNADDVLFWDTSAGTPSRRGYWRVVFKNTAASLVGLDLIPTAPCSGPLPPAANDGKLHRANCIFTVTGRALHGTVKKAHPAGAVVHLATALAAQMGLGSQGTLAAGIPADSNCPSGQACQPPTLTPFRITVTSTKNPFPTSGVITVWHSCLRIPCPPAEYMQYNNGAPLPPSCSPLGANQLCVVGRALGGAAKGQQAIVHPTHAPSGSPPARTFSYVTLHEQITVKDNNAGDVPGGFRESGTLLIYRLDPGTNTPIEQELVTYNNVGCPKCKPGGTPANQFHITQRQTITADLKPTPGFSHPLNSIVVAADAHAVCRAKARQPLSGPFHPGANANSAGFFPNCYIAIQPNDPKPPTFDPDTFQAEGSDLILLTSIGVPLFGTGPVASLPPFWAGIGQVDPNGSTDQIFHAESPCILNFTPGVNLQARFTFYLDKDFASVDLGRTEVVLDMVAEIGDPSHSQCNDSASSAVVTFTVYDAPGASDPTGNGDDDRDGDGCDDREELDANVTTGGQRDPWNKYDFYDIDGNKQVTLFGDIFGVALAFNQGPGGPQYTPAKDRGATYGPFGHNLSGPDGVITLFGDIFSVAAQFNHSCAA